MPETLSLPVLPLDDTIVLPTMVVPLDTSGTEVRAAIEAARHAASAPDSSETKPQLLLVPRLDGKYSPVGTLGYVVSRPRRTTVPTTQRHPQLAAAAPVSADWSQDDCSFPTPN